MSSTRLKRDEILDKSTQMMLNQHNRSRYQQKREDAVALRQKLEQWKEEKKKNLQEPRNTPFVKYVLHPSQRKAQEKAQVKLQSAGKKTDGQHACQVTTDKVQHNRRSIIKVADNRSRLGQSKGYSTSNKENRKSAIFSKASSGRMLPKPGKCSAVSDVSDCSKLSAIKMATPLSWHSVSGQHHIVNSSITRAEGGNKPLLNLADELHSTFYIPGEDALRSEKEQAVALDSGTTDDNEVKLSNSVDSSAKECTTADPGISREPQVKSRDSLSSQFRKAKQHFKPAKTSALKTSKHVPQNTAIKKRANSLSLNLPKSSLVSSCPKSILRQKSCGPRMSSSALGASPLLPSAAKPRIGEKHTGTDTVIRTVKHGDNHSPGGGPKRVVSSGHVTFKVDVGNADFQGALFRKTPGRSKSQENMKMKLNEWLAAKGRTPSGLRHAKCFGCETSDSIRRMPRSQVRASMSVEQLSRQENTLSKEDILTTPMHTGAVMLPNDNGLETNPLLPCHQQEMAEPKSGQNGENVHSLDKELQKCLAYIQTGLLSEDAALEWLDHVGLMENAAHHRAGWYKCRVAALRAKRDPDKLLAVLEKGIINNAQPASALAELVTATVKELLSAPSRNKRRHTSTTSRTPSKGRHSKHHLEVQPQNEFQSTVVKYSVAEITPFKKRRTNISMEEKSILVATPVRRSARFSSTKVSSLSEGRLPQGIHPLTEYTTLKEIPSAEKERMLFHPNEAVEPLLNDESPASDNLSMDIV